MPDCSESRFRTSVRSNLRSPRVPMRYALSVPLLLQRLTVLMCTFRRRATSLVVNMGLTWFNTCYFLPLLPINILYMNKENRPTRDRFHHLLPKAQVTKYRLLVHRIPNMTSLCYCLIYLVSCNHTLPLETIAYLGSRYRK